MGRIRTSEIKDAAKLLLEKYPDRFGADFEKNKIALNEINEEINIIKEKKLRNKIAGYITRLVKSGRLEKL